MSASDANDLLLEARDTFEWLSKDSGPYTGTASLHLYQALVTRLIEVGFPGNRYSLSTATVYPDGTMDSHAFGALVESALGWVQRELNRRGVGGSDSALSEAGTHVVPSSVFVVHGQDQNALDTILALLREVELLPQEFSEARRLTKNPMPYIGEVLDAAFKHAQSVVLLFTPDERVELQDRLRGIRPIVIGYQPRPNVLIEAGIALSTHPDRTVIVEMGEVRAITDLSGRHVVRWREDTPAARSELLDRLEEAGCHPNRQGTRWMDVGKIENPTWH